MSSAATLRSAATQVLDRDEVEGVLSARFYARAGSQSAPAPKPEHYKIICISLYTDDLRRLDAMVETLKARGLTKANRSALIRYALASVDLDRVPRGL